MKPRTKLRKLRALMKRFDVSAREVARILKVSDLGYMAGCQKGRQRRSLRQS